MNLPRISADKQTEQTGLGDVEELGSDHHGGIGGGCLTGFPRLVEPVSATSTAGVKQIPAPTCPQLGWPYQHCGTGKVRVVTTDRLN